MTINSRNKGASAERELIKLLKDDLGEGYDLKRNLEQTREGGYDITGLPKWALEVKRYADASPAIIRGWWEQAADQARAVRKIPVLAYRLDRRDWRIVIPMYAVTKIICTTNEYDWTVEMSLTAWTSLVREMA